MGVEIGIEILFFVCLLWFSHFSLRMWNLFMMNNNFSSFFVHFNMRIDSVPKLGSMAKFWCGYRYPDGKS